MCKAKYGYQVHNSQDIVLQINGYIPTKKMNLWTKFEVSMMNNLKVIEQKLKKAYDANNDDDDIDKLSTKLKT